MLHHPDRSPAKDPHRADLRATLAQIAPDDFDEAIALLKGSGLLRPAFWREAAAAMRQVAEADLALGRLYEGHVNAWHLIDTYADPTLRVRCRQEMESGLLFGVWGADGPAPVTARAHRLSGAKRFASGLGLVDRAIVTAQTDEGQRLYAVDAQDRARHDHAAWDMAGMRDSRSGGFDCAGLEARPLGPPDVYTREPHFLGGTWRIAAVTLGGTVGLLDRVAGVLRARAQHEAEAHLLRLSPVAGRVLSAWPAILRAAEVSSGAAGAADSQAAAARALSTRLLTEEIGQDAIAAAERSVGLALFAEGDPAGRMARDLACYMRQAARDAFSMKVGRALLTGPLGAWLDA
ncbi:acyl-CoA dehydrogenase [Citreimonas sp.]|uniref:acyl-CoA dehydrogenase n=1 Tax=Citreimonas sp. TaxID=3036715 RepID=UPI00405A23A8